MQPETLEKYALFAQDLASVSGDIIREAMLRNRSFVSKGDASPVTAIDRKIEEQLRKRITDRFPDHGILGEEFESFALDKELVWVIDPIDGTKAFIGGIPTFGTLIALACDGVPVIGIIDNPVTSERWVGVNGTRTKLNGRAVQSRGCVELSSAVLANGNPEPFDAHERMAFERLRESVNWCVYGGGCHAYGRVADGAIDINIDCGLDAFDYCALAPIVNNAGGLITDWEGKPLTIHSGHRCVASGDPDLHRLVLDRLAA